MTDTDSPEISAEESPAPAGDEFQPSVDSGEVRAPFAPESRQQLGGRGCAWMVGVGCGLLLLVAVGLIVAMTVNSNRLVAWSLGKFEQQILADVPQDFDQAQRDELQLAFTTARERIAAGEVDPQALQSFQSIMFELAFKPGAERTGEDYQHLIDSLRRLAGEEPVEDAPDIEPEPATDPGVVEAEAAAHRPVVAEHHLDLILA